MPLAVSGYRRQTKLSRRPLVVWLIVALTSLLLLSLIVGAPLAAAAGHTLFALAIYRPFATLCHQIPERSFFIAGHQFAVCARCTGIYVGFSLVTLFYPLVRSVRSVDLPQRKWLILAALPLAIDFSLTFFGIWENTHSSRFATGFLLGGVTVFYVMPGLAELSLQGWKNAKPAETAFTPQQIATVSSDYSAPHRRI